MTKCKHDLTNGYCKICKGYWCWDCKACYPKERIQPIDDRCDWCNPNNESWETQDLETEQ